MGAQAAAPLRLAILEADTPQPATKAKYGSYGGVFTSLLERAVAPAPLGSLLQISAHEIVHNDDADAYPALGDVDALLITGSRHSAFENEPWIETLVDYTRRAIDGARVRVVGVCFGHQIVARALGVPVKRSDTGWEVSVTDVQLTDKGREVFGMESLKIHQMHRDAVFGYPPGAQPLAETDACPNQGFLIPGRVITVQGHPEFTEGIVREILQLRHEVGILPDDVYQGGMDRVALDHDGVAVAQAFLRFVKG